MKMTILGSGGCMVIPKPLCQCRVCAQAREKGWPDRRTGPSAFLHDAGLLIDTPAEIAEQLNRADIRHIDHLMFTHLDPDHVEGFRVVEQIALDFRTWKAFPEKTIRLVLPKELDRSIREISTWYGPAVDFYEASGFLRREILDRQTTLNGVRITALPVDRGDRFSFVYVFEKHGRRLVYAPCDIKPFPKDRPEVLNPDLLVIQPGIFEQGLAHGFHYPEDHISRTTLYTFEQTLGLARDIGARKTVFVHLEEYWNRTHDDYLALARDHEGIAFAHDGLELYL